MATYGKAREITIAALRECKPFARKGFGMTAVEGPVTEFGKLPEEFTSSYGMAVRDGDVLFTVLSYATPIAWVFRDGTVIIPEVSYSRTTSHHQSLCRAYLAKS